MTHPDGWNEADQQDDDVDDQDDVDDEDHEVRCRGAGPGNGVDEGLVGEVLGRIEGLERRELKNTRLLVMLMGKGRSVGGLVALIHGRRPGEPDYRKLYMRVSRRLGRLEEEGLASRALFGKERPYRITRRGRMALSSALSLSLESGQGEGEGEGESPRTTAVWSRWYSAMLLFTVLALVGVTVSPGNLGRFLLFVFFFLLGSSLTLVALAIREVM